MDKKTPLSDIEKRISQLEERKKRLEFLSKDKVRKERARRLIETGALAEKYFEIENLSIPEREELFRMFSAPIVKKKNEKFKKQPEKQEEKSKQ